MFETRAFERKDFIGWIPSCLLLGIVVGLSNPSLSNSSSFWIVIFYTVGFTFGYFFLGLVFLGLHQLVVRGQDRIPLHWAIVWQTYPICSVLFIFVLIIAIGKAIERIF